MHSNKKSLSNIQSAARHSTIDASQGNHRSVAKEKEIESKFEKGKKLMEELNASIIDFEKNAIKKESKNIQKTISYYSGEVESQEIRMREEIEKERKNQEKWEEEQIAKIREIAQRRVQEKTDACEKRLSYFQGELEKAQQRLITVRNDLQKPGMLEKRERYWRKFQEDWETTNCGKFPFFWKTDEETGVDIWDWQQPEIEQEPMIKIGGKMMKLSDLENDERAKEAQRKTLLAQQQEAEAIAAANEKTRLTMQKHNIKYGISDVENPFIKATERRPSSYSNAASYEQYQDSYVQPMTEEEARLQHEEEVKQQRLRAALRAQALQREIEENVRIDCARFNTGFSEPPPAPPQPQEHKKKKSSVAVRQLQEKQSGVHTYGLPKKPSSD